MFWPSAYASLLFLVIAVAFVVTGLIEFFAITRKLGMPGFPRVTIAAGACYVALISINGFLLRSGKTPITNLDFVLHCIVAAHVIACGAALCRERDLSVGIRSLFVSLAGFLYLCWMLSFLPRIYSLDADRGVATIGPYLAFFVIMVTKSGDIGGYTFGKLTAMSANGNHKLAPRLSPKKSWEGLAGSIVFSILAATILTAAKGGTIAFDKPVVLVNYFTAVGCGALLAIVGLFGDLAESALKRGAEVKDSGGILPGMGGVLDALDSLIFIAPIFYLYLRFATA